LCPLCQEWAWILPNVDDLLSRAPPVDDRTTFVTLKMHLDRPALGCARACDVWARFVASTTWPMMGALQLEPGKRGWLANFHVVVWGADPAAIKRAWRDVGTNRGAHVEPLKSLPAAIRYAVAGAVDTSKVSTTFLVDWLRAMHGLHLVRLAHVGRCTRNRAVAVGSRVRVFADPASVSKRILAGLTTNPLAVSTLRGRFASHERDTFDVCLRALVERGQVVKRVAHRGGATVALPLHFNFDDM
jgi:hypothetical protein